MSKIGEARTKREFRQFTTAELEEELDRVFTIWRSRNPHYDRTEMRRIMDRIEAVIDEREGIA